MTNPIPCGLEDDRVRFEPDPVEPESVMTDAETRISWICDTWKDALDQDTFEAWSEMRHELYGAVQALNSCSGRRDDIKMIRELQNFAFENSLECIRNNRYER